MNIEELNLNRKYKSFNELEKNWELDIKSVLLNPLECENFINVPYLPSYDMNTFYLIEYIQNLKEKDFKNVIISLFKNYDQMKKNYGRSFQFKIFTIVNEIYRRIKPFINECIINLKSNNLDKNDILFINKVCKFLHIE